MPETHDSPSWARDFPDPLRDVKQFDGQISQLSSLRDAVRVAAGPAHSKSPEVGELNLMERVLEAQSRVNHMLLARSDAVLQLFSEFDQGRSPDVSEQESDLTVEKELDEVILDLADMIAGDLTDGNLDTGAASALADLVKAKARLVEANALASDVHVHVYTDGDTMERDPIAQAIRESITRAREAGNDR